MSRRSVIGMPASPRLVEYAAVEAFGAFLASGQAPAAAAANAIAAAEVFAAAYETASDADRETREGRR